MASGESEKAARQFRFEPSPSVAASRERSRYIDCPICQGDFSEYLFHRVGVRFVRCRSCAMVYTNPLAERGRNFFSIDAVGQYESEGERALAAADFAAMLERVEAEYARTVGKAPLKSVLLGRQMPEFGESTAAKRMGLRLATIDDAAFRALESSSDLSFAKSLLTKDVRIVFLTEFLEGCADPATVLEKLVKAVSPDTWIVVLYSNADSIPAHFLRRYWPPFFDYKSAFFNTNNLTKLAARFNLVLATQFHAQTTLTPEYVVRRLAPGSKAFAVARSTRLGHVGLPLRTGAHVAVFRPNPASSTATEKLSIIFPVFNEARYCAQVIEAVLAKQLPIERELIIVESNSTDGTRDIIKGFEGREGVRVVYEDRPRGKGHAVRTGLKAVTGSIVLIQDADFEYDIDDYDALLQPILQRRTSFVLGSRSLGLDDWKVRRFDNDPLKGLVLNSAQVLFAKTYSALYQQKRVTDVNTMFKVFRSECLHGLDLESNGFELDIELACKLARNGYAPLEVPVNYVSRGFDEGKKISFIRDSFPSYFALFKYRFR